MSDLNRQHMELERVKRKAGPTELYRHFDAKGVLLYIGISLSTAGRLGQHRSTSAWSKKVVTITIERFPTRKAALEAERQAIQNEHPLHNVTGKLKGFRVVASPTVYLATSEPDPDPSETPLQRYFREHRGQRGRAKVSA